MEGENMVFVYSFLEAKGMLEQHVPSLSQLCWPKRTQWDSTCQPAVKEQG